MKSKSNNSRAMFFLKSKYCLIFLISVIIIIGLLTLKYFCFSPEQIVSKSSVFFKTFNKAGWNRRYVIVRHHSDSSIRYSYEPGSDHILSGDNLVIEALGRGSNGGVQCLLVEVSKEKLMGVKLYDKSSKLDVFFSSRTENVEVSSFEGIVHDGVRYNFEIDTHKSQGGGADTVKAQLMIEE